MNSLIFICQFFGFCFFKQVRQQYFRNEMLCKIEAQKYPEGWARWMAKYVTCRRWISSMVSAEECARSSLTQSTWDNTVTALLPSLKRYIQICAIIFRSEWMIWPPTAYPLWSWSWIFSEPQWTWFWNWYRDIVIIVWYLNDKISSIEYSFCHPRNNSPQSFHPLRVQGSNWGCQTWQQVSSLDESRCL